VSIRVIRGFKVGAGGGGAGVGLLNNQGTKEQSFAAPALRPFLPFLLLLFFGGGCAGHGGDEN
jgi:hypothetical protein